MKSSIRSATIGAAVSAVALTGLAVAPAAHATTVKCDVDKIGTSFHPVCGRRTDDGDPGGVSGSVEVYLKSVPDMRAFAIFDANGEKFDAINYLHRPMRFVLQWKDGSGRIHTAVDRVLDDGERQSWNLSLPEGVRVCIATGDSILGHAGMTTLRA
ncbi:hypothetical protein [Streptomyces inhibens]|uniref:hypothetical protein n=1 Tax=Streptomyces inhibens TaxID=2293571 RepID=UPI001EE6B980|nr:hypothetical protein [Streptomyces inhibens]UKY54269.1 hypothetical protein KI385_39300 [Streptomyces inhibens]